MNSKTNSIITANILATIIYVLIIIYVVGTDTVDIFFRSMVAIVYLAVLGFTNIIMFDKLK